MKKYILSALAGAMVMLIAIAVMATIHAKKAQHPKEYEHIDYIENKNVHQKIIRRIPKWYLIWKVGRRRWYIIVWGTSMEKLIVSKR